MEYSFVKSQRGKEKLVFRGYVYVHQRSRGTTRKLAETDHWSMDGTFSSAPSLFLQIYTIHAIINEDNVAFPMIYALLPDKTHHTYVTLLREIQNVAVDNNIMLNPAFIIMHFELATINAVRQVFPNCIVKGCLFHLGQSVFRKVQGEGLAVRYAEDEILSMAKIALSFMPPDDIPDISTSKG